MLRKLIITPYFGGLPSWYSLYVSNILPLRTHGWWFSTWTDEEEFAHLCRKQLGLDYVPPLAWRRKVTDFFPMFGVIFSWHMQGFDYWGHGGLDQVYGRLAHFIPDEELKKWDIWSNDLDQICGPFTLYRNVPEVNTLFYQDPTWRNVLQSPVYHGYDEGGFSKLVNQSTIKSRGGVKYQHLMGEDPEDYEGITLTNGMLEQKGKEIMMFHFNRKQRWPIANS